MSSLCCEACGCTNFTCRSGVYICNNCDTQSQEIGDQRFEFIECGRAVDDDEEKEEEKSEKSVEERKLTSWECYNMVLVGLVDELIELGASRKIKVLAFQLWASYLQHSKVAFISKDEEKLPALSLGFRNSDVHALYGISNLKKKLYKNSVGRLKRSRKSAETDTNSESLSIASSRSIKAKRRKVAIDETMTESDFNLSDRETETLDSLEKERQSQKSLKKNIVFKSSTRNMLREIISDDGDDDDDDEPPPDPSTFKKRVKKHKSKIVKMVYDRTFETPSEKGPNVPLTSITLITIIRIALQLANDDIFLCDILRWICEGRLSVNQPEKFVPLFYLYVKKNDLLNAHRRAFQLEIRNFTFNQDLCDLPTPNLFKLAERFCTELCVPDDLLQLVLKLIVDSKVEMNYENYKFRIFPDYECRVMAFILFAFKLLFSLDDSTELQQSTFVNTVNESPRSQSNEEIPKLFCWNSWLRFMQCRKAVLSCYNVPISQRAYGEKYCDENVLLNHWEKVKPTYGTTEPRCKRINEALLSSLSQEIRSLSYEYENVEGDATRFVDCPASVTPWVTLTEHILKNYSSSLSTQTKEILSECFKTHSIRYATDPNWCSDIADNLGMEVEFCSQAENCDFEIYERNNYSFFATCSSTRTRCDRLVPVIVKKQSGPKQQAEPSLCPFRASVRERDSESSDESRQSRVKLYRTSLYWCLHECSVLSVEEFENLARQTFPRSFRWLLCECATMLQADVKELYGELVLVESVLHRLYGEPKMKKSFVRIRMNECYYQIADESVSELTWYQDLRTTIFRRFQSFSYSVILSLRSNFEDSNTTRNPASTLFHRGCLRSLFLLHVDPQRSHVWLDMALIHRSLFTWFVFLIFFTLVILHYDSRILWPWSCIFVPMWLYDFISIFYLIFYLLSHFRNGFCHEDLRVMFWKTWLLLCVLLKIIFQILLCIYLDADKDKPPRWLPLHYVMIPAWILMVAFSLNLIAKIRIYYYKSG